MLNACVYIYIWLSLGNCIEYLYFRFFIHSVDAELSKNHLAVYPFTLIELFGFVSPCHNVIYLERGLLMYWNWLTRQKKKPLTSLLYSCCCLVFLLWAQSAQSQHGFQGSTCLITRAPPLWWTTATTSTTSSSCPARATWASAHQGQPLTSRARVHLGFFRENPQDQTSLPTKATRGWSAWISKAAPQTSPDPSWALVSRSASRGTFSPLHKSSLGCRYD